MNCLRIHSHNNNNKNNARGKKLTFMIALLVMALFVMSPVTVSAADNPLILTINQVFTTTSDSADNTFTYRLVPDQASNPLPVGGLPTGYTFTISGSDSIQIGPIVYSLPGLFKYKLEQLVSSAQTGYTYDRHVYGIEVYVDNDLKIDVIVYNMTRDKVDAIEFLNDYIAPRIPPVDPLPDDDTPEAPTTSPLPRPLIDITPPDESDNEEIDDDLPLVAIPSDRVLMVDPPIRKTVTGNPRTETAFTFRLTAHNPLNPMPDGSVNGVKTITIMASEVGEFGTWSYYREGVYYYTVSEVNTGVSGYTYDTSVYTITDMVNDENGQLVVSRVVTNGTYKPVTSLTFINKFSAPDSPGTGDDMNTAFYICLLIFGGMTAIGAAAYIVLGSRKKGIADLDE